MLEWTGERFLPWIEDTQMHYEHLHRYAFASRLVKNKKVLDLACGEGYGTNLLAKEAKYVVGIEIDEQTVKHASKRYKKNNLKFIKASILNIPIKQNYTFDVVTCFEAIEHIYEHKKLLSEVKRLLKPEGIFIVSTPNKEEYSERPQYKNPFHLKELYYNDFKKLLNHYFKNTHFLGQRMYTGSDLWDLSPIQNLRYAEFVINKHDKEFSFTKNIKKIPRYFIAIASDGEIETNIAHVDSWLVDISDVLVKDYQKQVGNLNNALQDKEANIIKLNTNLQAENQKMTELSATLQAKDAEIAELNNTLQTEDQKMTELSYTLLVKNSEIAGLNADLQTKNQKIAELSTTLQAEDAEIAELNADLQTEKQKIAELNNTLQVKDTEIAELKTTLQTKDQKIAELSTNLQAKEAEIAELKTTLQNKEYQISSIDLQVQQIQGGVGMYLLKKYRQVVDKLLPAGKRRRYYYGLLMKGARIILDEGWRSFFKKTRNWFRRRRSLVKRPTLVLPRLRNLVWEKEVQKIVLPKTSKKPELSIVIPVYNKLQYTLNCLQSIYLNTKADYEVIVVDDASTDETADALSKITHLRLIRNVQNVGFIDSVSRGADECRGNYIIFLNNDTMVTKDWLPPLLALIKRDDVGAVGAKLVYPDGKLQEAGGIIWSDGLGWNFGRGDDPEKPEYNYVREVDYCSGACLCVKRKLFKRIGGFDKRFRPAYFDDSDLCFSIRNLGYKVMYQPMTVIAHHEGASSGTDTSSGVKRFQEINRPKFIEKWHDVLEKKHYLHDDANDFVARERVSGKRILIIDHYVPTYDKDAGSLTIYQYTKLFNDMGFKVIFIPDNMYRSEPYTSELQQMGIEVIYGQANYQFNFDSWIKENGHYIDIVFLSRPHISIKYIDAIKRYTKAKILYYMHDLHYLRELRRYEIEKDPRILKESQRWKNIEFKLFNGADVVLTPSSAEADIISRELPKKQKNIRVIPPYLYDEFPKKNVLPSFRAKKDIVFLGGFQHTPNIDAVQWFVEKCFPRIVKAIPDVKFFIVGSSPVPEIEKLASANVKVTGYVKDLAPIFKKARVFVAPLRYGAGLKGKIVTSMYYGVPVVTTTIGAEGMDLTDGVDALIADDEAEFAKKVVRLYKDKSLWDKLSENSIKKVKADYSLEAARESMSSILQIPSKYPTNKKVYDINY